MRYLKILACLLPLTLVLGCTDFGKVDQGRVVAFDKQARKFTMIDQLKILLATLVLVVMFKILYELIARPDVLLAYVGGH